MAVTVNRAVSKHFVSEKRHRDNIVDIKPLTIALATGTTVTAHHRFYVRILMAIKTVEQLETLHYDARRFYRSILPRTIVFGDISILK